MPKWTSAFVYVMRFAQYVGPAAAAPAGPAPIYGPERACKVSLSIFVMLVRPSDSIIESKIVHFGWLEPPEPNASYAPELVLVLL